SPFPFADSQGKGGKAGTHRCPPHSHDAGPPRRIQKFVQGFAECPVTYNEWEETVPDEIRRDQLWSLRVYRASLYSGDVAREDGRVLVHDPLTIEIAAQLVRAVGAVSANIAAGYSRFARRDRVQSYESALGSAREGRDWYFHGRGVLGEQLVLHRVATLGGIARVLIVLISRARV
ncbi:MAG: four helix bundle protein, partial [Gemmatimonadaceae bacterium]